MWNGGNRGYIWKERFYDIYSCFLSDNDQMVSFYSIAEGFDTRLTTIGVNLEQGIMSWL